MADQVAWAQHAQLAGEGRVFSGAAKATKRRRMRAKVDET
jgi:hypothetical protein